MTATDNGVDAIITEAALEAVAAALVARLLHHALESGTAYEAWEDFPEIGADDWAAVLRRVRALAKTDADSTAFDAAYAHLKGRAGS